MIPLHLTLPEPPSANRWWRKWKNRMVLSPEARAYKASLWGTFLRRPIPAKGPVAVTLRWYRSRKSGDLDKRIGVVLDALQGFAYRDDKQIVRLLAERFDDPKNPRIEIIVEDA